MPRITASRCRPDSPLACPERKDAPQPGLWFDERWLWSDGGFIVEVIACPYCGGFLPLMRGKVESPEAAARRIWANIVRKHVGDDPQ